MLSRRQKRLKSWITAFNKDIASDTKQKELGSMLETYCLLISKLASAPNAEHANEAEERLLSLERKLTSIFEALRLKTSGLTA